MKRTVLCLLVALLAVGGLFAQEEEKEATLLVSPNIFGPIFGIYSASFEFAMGESLGLEISPTYFNLKMSVIGGLVSDDFKFWLISGSIGPNYYFSGDALEGFFLGAFGTVGYGTIGDKDNELKGVSLGGGAKLGYRWIWSWFSLGPQLGIGYRTVLVDADVLDTDLKGQAAGINYFISLGIALAF